MAINRKIKKLLFTFGVLVTIIYFLPFVGKESTQSAKDTYDVIIVLGNSPENDCQPSLIMKQRVEKGIELFQQGVSNKILFSGGVSVDGCVEAWIMRDIALSKGVPDSCIIMEEQSKNTYQNAFYSVRKMEKMGLKTMAIVTSEFHKKRVGNIFANYDIEYRLYSCSDPPKSFNTLIWKIREHTILIYHTIFGYSVSFGLP